MRDADADEWRMKSDCSVHAESPFSPEDLCRFARLNAVSYTTNTRMTVDLALQNIIRGSLVLPRFAAVVQLNHILPKLFRLQKCIRPLLYTLNRFLGRISVVQQEALNFSWSNLSVG